MPTDPLNNEECKHPSTPEPIFDEEAAKGLSAEEVRKRWPRVFAPCIRCGSHIIKYASFMHYVSGDW